MSWSQHGNLGVGTAAFHSGLPGGLSRSPARPSARSHRCHHPVILGLIACLGSTLWACGSRQNAVSAGHSYALVLHSLRQQLAGRPVPRHELHALHGVSKTLVRSMLGSPHRCGTRLSAYEDACQHSGDWLFAVREPRRGSQLVGPHVPGPLLRLRFDPFGRVSSARWLPTPPRAGH